MKQGHPAARNHFAWISGETWRSAPEFPHTRDPWPTPGPPPLSVYTGFSDQLQPPGLHSHPRPENPTQTSGGRPPPPPHAKGPPPTPAPPQASGSQWMTAQSYQLVGVGVGEKNPNPTPFGLKPTRTSGLRGNPDILASKGSQKQTGSHQIHGHKPGGIRITGLDHPVNPLAGPKASALAPACSSCGHQRAPVPLTELTSLPSGSSVKVKSSPSLTRFDMI